MNGHIDTTSMLIATAALVVMLVLLGAALYFGRRIFMGEGAEERREIAQKKREMELLIQTRIEPELKKEPPPAAEFPPGLTAATPAKSEKKKEQWEVDAEASEYTPK